MSASHDEDRLLHHDYDGIQEYDNPMPRWWVLIFWATIVFAAVYLLNVVPIVGAGKGWHANYADEMAAAEKTNTSLQRPVKLVAPPPAPAVEESVPRPPTPASP